MKRSAFVYEIDKCIGCRACQVACKDKNKLEPGTFFRRVDIFPYESKIAKYSGACNHCKEAACVKNCPSGSLYYAYDNTVQHDDGKCIGCGSCVWSCPYGAPKLSKKKGVSSKCNFCMDLREKGEEPACVEACITHCLSYKDVTLEELKVAYDEHPDFLPSAEKTNPSLIIKYIKK